MRGKSGKLRCPHKKLKMPQRWWFEIHTSSVWKKTYPFTNLTHIMRWLRSFCDLSYNEFPYIIFESKHFALKNPDEQAYILQNNFENALVDYLCELKRLNYLEENICLAGGSFLNVLGNSRLKKLEFNIHVPPCTNDSGLHFGAACFGVFQNKQKIWIQCSLLEILRLKLNFPL